MRNNIKRMVREKVIRKSDYAFASENNLGITVLSAEGEGRYYKSHWKKNRKSSVPTKRERAIYAAELEEEVYGVATHISAEEDI